jgi:hypothetical protein
LAQEDEGGRESREGESVCDAREGGGDVRIRFRAGAGRRGSGVERRAPSTTARERGEGVLSEEETGARGPFVGREKMRGVFVKMAFGHLNLVGGSS